MLGAGAANIATCILLEKYGFDPGKMILIDRGGILHPERSDMESMKSSNRWKYEIALRTNRDRVRGGLREALVDADSLIAISTPGPGVVKKGDVKLMAKDPIFFAPANPVPEIWPWEAQEAGAVVFATGRSDLPKQVNISLIFPSVFRGALDCSARRITYETMISSAVELARCAEGKGLSPDYIIPTMEEWMVFPRVAAAVADSLSREGLARRKVSYQEELGLAQEIISRARQTLKAFVDSRIVVEPPESWAENLLIG